MAKLFIPLIKGKVSSRFEAIFGKLNFWWKFDRRGPTKLGADLNCAKKEFLFDSTGAPYKNSENFVLS